MMSPSSAILFAPFAFMVVSVNATPNLVRVGTAGQSSMTVHGNGEISANDGPTYFAADDGYVCIEADADHSEQVAAFLDYVQDGFLQTKFKHSKIRPGTCSSQGYTMRLGPEYEQCAFGQGPILWCNPAKQVLLKTSPGDAIEEFMMERNLTREEAETVETRALAKACLDEGSVQSGAALAARNAKDALVAGQQAMGDNEFNYVIADDGYVCIQADDEHREANQKFLYIMANSALGPNWREAKVRNGTCSSHGYSINGGPDENFKDCKAVDGTEIWIDPTKQDLMSTSEEDTMAEYLADNPGATVEEAHKLMMDVREEVCATKSTVQLASLYLHALKMASAKKGRRKSRPFSLTGAVRGPSDDGGISYYYLADDGTFCFEADAEHKPALEHFLDFNQNGILAPVYQRAVIREGTCRSQGHTLRMGPDPGLAGCDAVKGTILWLRMDTLHLLDTSEVDAKRKYVEEHNTTMEQAEMKNLQMVFEMCNWNIKGITKFSQMLTGARVLGKVGS